MTISMQRLDRLPAPERGLTIGDFLVPIRVSERLYTRARHIGLVLIGVLLITVGAQVALSVPGAAFLGLVLPAIASIYPARAAADVSIVQALHFD